MDMAWARSIRDQCVAQGVAFFFKQDSASRMEARPWIVEEDGSRWSWQQKPGKLTPPERL
jgi:protein gp37